MSWFRLPFDTDASTFSTGSRPPVGGRVAKSAEIDALFTQARKPHGKRRQPQPAA